MRIYSYNYCISSHTTECLIADHDCLVLLSQKLNSLMNCVNSFSYFYFVGRSLLHTSNQTLLLYRLKILQTKAFKYVPPVNHLFQTVS